MENLSTPIADKQGPSLDEDGTMCKSNIYENENKLRGLDSTYFGHMSPIDNNKSVSKVVEREDVSAAPETIVENDSLQDDEDEASSESYNYDGADSDDDSAGVSPLLEDLDIKDIDEVLGEMSQAVHKYLNRIKHLDIPIEWELSKTLIPENGIRKSKSGLKGPLGPEEVSFLEDRLKQFCEEYNVNNTAIRACLAEGVSKFKFPNELRLKFIQYLCKDYVTDRNLMTVFKCITKLGIRKGRFTMGEENFLIDMYHNYKGKHLHSVCGLMLNRHRVNILRKIERLKKKDLLGLRASSDDLNTKSLKLRKLILKNILNRKNYDVKLLKCRINMRTWKSIGREYNVSPASAKAIYLGEILPQIFAEHPVKFNRFFAKMIYTIHRSDWLSWEEVKWNDLSTSLYNVGPVLVYAMLRKIIIHFVPKENWNKFRECAKYLYEKVLPYFENGPKKITLNRISIERFEEGS